MQKILNSLKGYRTIIVQAVLALLGVLVALGIVSASDAAGITAESIGQQFDTAVGGAIVITSVIGLLMRLVTNTPVGKKSPEAPKVTG